MAELLRVQERVCVLMDKVDAILGSIMGLSSGLDGYVKSGLNRNSLGVGRRLKLGGLIQSSRHWPECGVSLGATATCPGVL